MNKKYRVWFLLSLFLIPALACSSPFPSLSRSTATPVPVVNGGGGDNGGGNPVPGSITSTPSPVPSASPSPSPTASTPTPTITPMTDHAGPYLVKQIVTYGGEVISGTVCNALKPFDVRFVTPKVTFVTHYFPANGAKGNWAYAYSITSAGETHDARGTYTLQQTDKTGVLLLTMTGSDHVVFHGFDGKMPSRYQFDLVEASIQPCP